MRIPRIKDLKSKLSAAKLLGVVVKNSLAFKIKRRALKRFKATEFDTIIVDMDGTLYKTDANLEALSLAYPQALASGKTAGEELYDSILSKIASGEHSIEKAILEGNKFLIAKDFSRKDFSLVLEKIKPSIRKPLVKALAHIKASGKTVVLATLSSKEFGESLNSYLNHKFGFSFDHIVGTELGFDSSGHISGVNSIVGTKDFSIEGIEVKSKLTAIKQALESSGKVLDIKNAVLITDSYGDIDLAKSLVTILIKTPNPTRAQKVSYSLKLADYILSDNKDLQTNLESIIFGTEKVEE